MTHILKSFEEDMVVNGESPKIYFRQEGNLFLVAAEAEEAARRALKMQTQLGCRVEWWSNQQIKEHFPLYEPQPFVGGTYGPDDGYFDAYAVLMAYRSKSRSLGVNYLKDKVVTISTSKNRVTGVQSADHGLLAAARVVNCAGAWAAEVAKTAGVDLPVVPVKRQVFVLDTAYKFEKPLPLTILPSGLYFRSETGGLILLGKSMQDDPIGFSFSWDEQRFINDLWTATPFSGNGRSSTACIWQMDFPATAFSRDLQ
jgi:glycine/D-amino acid oxidase-like deaminating enzyme